MKAIQFVVILFIGFSLLIPSKATVKGIYLADINEIPDCMLTVQGGSLTDDNKDIGTGQMNCSLYDISDHWLTANFVQHFCLI